MTPETYTLTLRAEPGDERPPVVRLRAGLKFLLRACRLRVVEVRPGQPDAYSPEALEQSLAAKGYGVEFTEQGVRNDA